MAFWENPTVIENTEQQNLPPQELEGINNLWTPKNLSNKILENWTIAKNQEAIEKIEDLYEILKLTLENSELEDYQKEQILNNFEEISQSIVKFLRNNQKIEFYIPEMYWEDILDNINLKDELNKIIKESVYIEPKFEKIQDIKWNKNIELSDTFETILWEEYITELENKLPDFIDNIQIDILWKTNQDNIKYLISFTDSTWNIHQKQIELPRYIIKEITENKEFHNLTKYKNYIENNINTLIDEIKIEWDRTINFDNKKNKFEDIDLSKIKLTNFDQNDPLNITFLKKIHYHTDIDITKIEDFEIRKSKSNNKITLTIFLQNWWTKEYHTELYTKERKNIVRNMWNSSDYYFKKLIQHIN